ncbi:MAG TPA: hypothetical protein DCP28_32820, partial [Cytophagales bacterium]|nr:hypothetical protein [Cytophagales bacterium]
MMPAALLYVSSFLSLRQSLGHAPVWWEPVLWSHVWEGLVILWLPAFLYVLVRFGRRLWGVRWVRTCLLIVAMGVCLVSVALMAYWKGERAQHLPPTAQILFVSEEESSLRALLSRP